MSRRRNGPAAVPAAALAATLAAGMAADPAGAGDGIATAGDALGYLLPGAAAICAAGRDDIGPFAGRLAAQAAVTQGLKHGLGDAPLNRRPDGDSGGFPSGHAGAAFYGASYLARACLDRPGGKALAYGLATAAAASRLHADRHDLGQVVAGALLGLVSDRLTVAWDGRRVTLGWRRDF